MKHDLDGIRDVKDVSLKHSSVHFFVVFATVCTEACSIRVPLTVAALVCYDCVQRLLGEASERSGARKGVDTETLPSTLSDCRLSSVVSSGQLDVSLDRTEDEGDLRIQQALASMSRLSEVADRGWHQRLWVHASQRDSKVWVDERRAAKTRTDGRPSRP